MFFRFNESQIFLGLEDFLALSGVNLFFPFLGFPFFGKDRT